MNTLMQSDASVRRDNDKIREGNNQSQLQFKGVVVVFRPVQEQFSENTNKRYHVCRVIVVLHIYHKMFGIR